MKTIGKALDIIYSIVKWATAIMLIFAVLLMFTEVIRRYLFNLNWVWSEELIRYIIVYCTFFGGMAAFRTGALVRFDLVVLKMSKKSQFLLEMVCNSVILVLALWFFKLSVETFLRPSIANQMSAALHFSIKWIYLAMPIGFALMILFSLEKFFTITRDYRSANAESQTGGAAQ